MTSPADIVAEVYAADNFLPHLNNELTYVPAAPYVVNNANTATWNRNVNYTNACNRHYIDLTQQHGEAQQRLPVHRHVLYEKPGRRSQDVKRPSKKAKAGSRTMFELTWDERGLNTQRMNVDRDFRYITGLKYFFQRFVRQSPMAAVLVWSFLFLVELAIIIVYTVQSSVDEGDSWVNYVPQDYSKWFYICFVLSLISLLQLLFAYSLSFTTILVVVSTTVYLIVLFFVSLPHRLSWVSRMYVPFFLRIWPLRQYFLLLIDSIAVMTPRNRKLDLFRLAAGPLTLFIALVFTAAGCFRIDQAFQNYPMNIAVSLYFIIVTVTTVGFGDVVPRTQDGKVIVIVIILIFIAQMPTFIQAIRSSVKIFRVYRSYSGRRKHFIVYGRVERHEAISILDEVFRLYPMKSVCFCNKQFDDDVLAIGRHPRYRLRSDFLTADNLDAYALRRLKAHHACAVIIFPSQEGYTSRVDDNVMLTSVIFERLVPQLPQYIWLRYGLHANLLQGHRIAVIEEHMKKNIVAVALLMPGVVPFLVNIIRTACPRAKMDSNEPDHERMSDWRRAYTHSRRQVLSSCPVPLGLIHSTVREIASVFHKHGILVVAIHEHARQMMRLDFNYTVAAEDYLLVIFEGNHNELEHALEFFSSHSLHEVQNKLNETPFPFGTNHTYTADHTNYNHNTNFEMFPTESVTIDNNNNTLEQPPAALSTTLPPTSFVLPTSENATAVSPVHNFSTLIPEEPYSHSSVIHRITERDFPAGNVNLFKSDPRYRSPQTPDSSESTNASFSSSRSSSRSSSSSSHSNSFTRANSTTHNNNNDTANTSPHASNTNAVTSTNNNINTINTNSSSVNEWEVKRWLCDMEGINLRPNGLAIRDINLDAKTVTHLRDLIARYNVAHARDSYETFMQPAEKEQLLRSLQSEIDRVLYRVSYKQSKHKDAHSHAKHLHHHTKNSSKDMHHSGNNNAKAMHDDGIDCDIPEHEAFLFVDQTTSILRKRDASIYEDVISQTIAQYQLYVMMQCICSIHPESHLTLLTLRPHSEKFMQAWVKIFGSPLNYIRGQGSLDSHLNFALLADKGVRHVRGVLIYCSQMGPRDFGDVPIFAVGNGIHELLAWHGSNEQNDIHSDTEQHMMIELQSFISAGKIAPFHSDPEWRKLGEENFQDCLAFMMGRCFSSCMLLPLMIHSHRDYHVPRFFEMVLNLSSTAELFEMSEWTNRVKRSRTLFRFWCCGHDGIATYGDAFDFILRERSCICIGVFRRFPFGYADSNPRYFITNPPRGMYIVADDIIYCLNGGANQSQW